MNASAHSIGVVKRIEPPYSVAMYTKHHFGDRDRDQQRGDGEHVRHARVDAGDELVVRPHDEAQDAGGRSSV